MVWEKTAIPQEGPNQDLPTIMVVPGLVLVSEEMIEGAVVLVDWLVLERLA